ncbi:methionine sulfoxide reductase [candidate division GN15 bacterium]|uniref:Peptide methionine sulfoxide reductase MsrA n=1 Tax=candidate division GN15 bacterium TaxID=2072418 RepID=A0A855X6D5_9BACT|nr:MAG: methionine sulfoxide reductase [candidate division GN15 bacterium]
MILNKLTPEEERVIVHKGTEAPFTGKYDNFYQTGTYVCKQCGAPLFKSHDKFDAGCGWPSFDDAIPGAVIRTPDPDGQRVEITCAKCGAHLGHVFTGEGFTPKDTRYCVNSISMNFIPVAKKVTTETAYFAGGCFWGVEYFLKKAPGVVSARVGYMGGTLKNPTYEEVSDHGTGHAETVEVDFDPTRTTYEDVAKLFFDIHDPTELNRQGPDVGDQYRSAIFYTSDAQKQTAEKLIGILKAKGLKVVTQVVPAGHFWVAETYHQDYYQRTGGEPYCHVYTDRFSDQSQKTPAR